MFTNLLLALSISVLAQAPTAAPVFDFQKAYQDFVFNFDQYRSAESEYDLSRSQYLQSKTLAAGQKAQESTYKFLQARDEVVKTYLTTLRMKLSELPGVSSDKRQTLETKIDGQVSWFGGHKTGIPSAASLEDLVVESKTAQTQYEKITGPIIYEVLTEIAIGKGVYLRQKQSAIISELESKISEIRQNGDLSTDFIERSLVEIKNRQQRSEVKENEARTLLNAISKEKDKSKSFSNITFRMSESIQYLKEANTYLKEIIGQIKNGQ